MATYIYHSELWHHGILGQKWGKRNGPPYPLDDDDHSKSEEKAGWKKSLKDATVKKVSKIVSDQSKDTTYTPKKKNAVQDKWNSLSDRQKKAVKIGAAIAVSALAAYGAYRIIKSRDGSVKFIDPKGDARNALTDLTIKQVRGKNLMTRFISEDVLKESFNIVDANTYTAKKQINSLNELRKWPSGENTVDNCIEVINTQLSGLLEGRNFQQLSYEEQLDIFEKVPVSRTQNCMFCTTAYELNRRGFLCQANDRSTGGLLPQIADMFKITDKNAIMTYRYDKGTISNRVSKAKEILETYTKTYPNGARGNMIVSWKQGGGHSMAWEIINNKFTIIDAQSGIKYDSPPRITELLSRTTGDIFSVRTDNAELNENAAALLNAIMPETIRL